MQGGLGNQLFQLAAYAKIYETGRDVFLDVSGYNLPKNNGYRKYLLNYFDSDVPLKLCILYRSPMGFIKKKILNRGIKLFSIRRISHLYKMNIHHGLTLSNDMIEIGDNTYVEGFFLNERFFPKNTFIDFKKKCKEIEKVNNLYLKIKNCNSVSVHIRRTDYLSESEINQYSNICTKEYYNKAISFFNDSNIKYTFFFFSDDIEWVKKEFNQNNNYYFVEHEDFCDTTISDLFLMSSCKNNIIANSTYSWWGAYLNNNSKKIVIRPKKYQNNTDEAIFPQDWMMV